MKSVKLWTTIIVFVMFASVVSASMLIPFSDKAKEHAKSPVIGDNGELERIDFIHYAKPENPGKPTKVKEDPCFKLMGVKWKSLPVNYYVNPSNPDGLTEEFVMSAISSGAEAWDDVTPVELIGENIDYSVAFGVQDFKNSIVFGAYPEPNAIAVTSIWYTKRGKEIVEFDMIFNTNFIWGDGSANPSLMDLQNIATHEFGHGVGLSDIYSDECSVVTMYGYSYYGDLEKRILEQPDITGLQQMY